ncbi:MAG: proteobacterial dedicated sortase system response regulator [Congregibacter sp.]
MPQHIVIVEDEAALAANYCDALRQRGFRVSHYIDRPTASRAFGEGLPDLAIIDISLGSDLEGGFELCRELRAQSAELPIVFLTARDDDIDVVSGFRLGADDYLSKNISLLHLQVRVSALLARSNTLRGRGDEESILHRGVLTLDTDRMEVQWRERALGLTVTEYWIVEALARRPGHVKSRQQLMEAANTVLDDSTVTSHIKRIRRKFQQVDDQFAAIETAYGMGYRWLDT